MIYDAGNAHYINGRQGRPLPILIVEDDPDYQLLIRHSLQIAIPRVEPTFVMTDGEALEHLELSPISQTTPYHFPQLVLLDIYLPYAEIGWQLLRKIRTRYPCLPIVALSSCQDADHIRKAYDLGVHAYMTKPSNIQNWIRDFQVFYTYWASTVTLPTVY